MQQHFYGTERARASNTTKYIILLPLVEYLHAACKIIMGLCQEPLAKAEGLASTPEGATP